MADVRQRIISSVFSKRNASGTIEENYVSHVKIWEDAGTEGKKPRYILLSQASNGSGFIHKSKLNTNGSFSVGKTWRLSELRGVQVLNPLAFNVTLARTYKWQTEAEAEQNAFLTALVALFRDITGGGTQLILQGFPDVPSAIQTSNSDHAHSVSPPSSRQPVANHRAHPSSQTSIDPQRIPSPAPRSQSRNDLPSRPSSPDKVYPSTRPHETSQSPARPRQGRRPSNAASTSSQIPSSVHSQPIPTHRQPSSIHASRSVRADSPTFPATTVHVTNSPAKPRPASPVIEYKPPPRGYVPPPVDLDVPQSRRDQNARVSFFDPANQATLDRLITGSEVQAEEETVHATMANVEEMLEGYEWASEDIIGGRKTARGAADLIQARLLDELMALEKANIHSFLESDDRIGLVLKYMDQAVEELDSMDTLVSSYKIHLNAVSDDILYIQSQNRGLQVQTQNQRALLKELENLLQTVHVDREALITLTQEPLGKESSLSRIEEAATELYKALQAGRDTDMAATMERLDEYKTHNAQFCKRMYDFLSIMFPAQGKMLLGETDGLGPPDARGRPTLVQHNDIELYLGRYAGLMLYLKEMDENVYSKICASYFSAASDLHNQQFKAVFTAYAGYVKKSTEDDADTTFNVASNANASKAGSGMRRAGTIIRSPMEGRRERDRNQAANLNASEAFGLLLENIAPHIYRENDFITDFLQINDAALTFADYMGLENYFKRQAARGAGLSQPTMKLVRGAMDLIFGFLPADLKTWLDEALAKDNIQIIGIIASLERFLTDADERGNMFLLNLLEKSHMRLKGLFDRHMNEQISRVEQTKLTSKKREGVAPFVRHFPIYVGRVENQLIGADTLEIRGSVDAAYEKIVQTMFESLKQMAKLDGEEEDKGQLNYHVILVENMHHFMTEIMKLEVGSVAGFLSKAQTIYDENLGAYVKLVLRRPFSKIIDYFEGIERLLKTTAPTEIATNTNYNKAALKKITKEYTVKDVRKLVDVLFRRVEKHYTDASETVTTEENGGIAPGTVMVGVWKACEEELIRITELFTRRISQCYGDSGMSLDYANSDVEAAFRRHRVGF